MRAIINIINRLFRHRHDNQQLYDFFQKVLGYTPHHWDLYQTALTHKSMSQTVGDGHRINNERLEYLGDAVLSTIVAEYLYKKYPYYGEGFLTEMRSKIVSRASLNSLAQTIGMSDLIVYNREQKGIFKSINGDAFEALVGAMYLERGYQCTKHTITERLIKVYLDINDLEHTTWNYKGKLIDWGQKNSKKISFEVVRVIPGSRQERKRFESRVLIDGKPIESGIDYTIKAAEQLAAENTFAKLNLTISTSPEV